jgi:hypothetical protein
MPQQSASRMASALGIVGAVRFFKEICMTAGALQTTICGARPLLRVEGCDGTIRTFPIDRSGACSLISTIRRGRLVRTSEAAPFFGRLRRSNGELLLELFDASNGEAWLGLVLANTCVSRLAEIAGLSARELVVAFSAP